MEINTQIYGEIKSRALHYINSGAGKSVAESGLNMDGRLTGSNIFVEKNIYNPGQVIKAGKLQIPIERNTLMVFADDEPLLNWSHKCRYLFFDSNDGELYKVVDANYPPYRLKLPETYEVISQPVSFPDELPVHYPEIPTQKVKLLPGKKRKTETGRNKFALLFSGATENRHLNDLEFLYRTLVLFHEFPAENIYVLNYDGTTGFIDNPFQPQPHYWPGTGSPYQLNVNAPGTKSELENVFNELKQRLKPEDLLFIHTNNHGDGPGADMEFTESCLDTFSDPAVYFTASEFAEKLYELPKFDQLLVMMEQCHSGGFGNPIIKKSPARETCFVSACGANKTSMGGQLHNPFARGWITMAAGMSGGMVNGFFRSTDPDTSGWENNMHPKDTISIPSQLENFNAAKINSPLDTPVILENPDGCSSNINIAE